MLFSVFGLQAQDNKGFIDEFNNAKLHLANHKFGKAIPVLEELYQRDAYNANLNYLLGLCYVKSNIKIQEAVDRLEMAATKFSRDYDPSSYKERNAPEYVYYYLIIAYSKNGQCKEALATLNTFYTIYSYEDEYYLIDGQKWVVECAPEEKEEEIPALKIDTNGEEVVVLEDTLAIDTTPVVAEVETESFLERLNPINTKKEIGTKTVEYTTLSSLYGIQVGAFLEPRFTREFADLKNVEVYLDQNGVYRYVIGRFNFKSQAETLLKLIKERGYNDAFIVDVNNADRYTEEVITVDNESIHQTFIRPVDYRVQIGAFKEKNVQEKIANYYFEIEGIQEIVNPDWTILTVGSYGNYDAAAEYRRTLQEKGFPDAFVVAFSGNKKIALKEAERYTTKQREMERQAELEEDDEDEKPKKKKKRGRSKNKKAEESALKN